MITKLWKRCESLQENCDTEGETGGGHWKNGKVGKCGNNCTSLGSAPSCWSTTLSVFSHTLFITDIQMNKHSTNSNTFPPMKADLESFLYLLQWRFEGGGSTSASRLTLTKFSPFYLIFSKIFLRKNLCIEKIHIVSKVHWKHCALQNIIMSKRRNI